MTITSGSFALLSSLGNTTCQWDTGTRVCQLFTGSTFPVADACALFGVKIEFGRTLAFTQAIACCVVKEEISVWTKWNFVTSARTCSLVELQFVWAGKSLGALALACVGVEEPSFGTCLHPGAHTATGFDVEYLILGAFTLVDAITVAFVRV